MNDFFAPVTTQELQKCKPGYLVKFHARFVKKDTYNHLHYSFINHTLRINVDVSAFDTCICEPGEWFRIMGDIAISAFDTDESVISVRAFLIPTLVDGYDVDEYEKMLEVKRAFCGNLDNLVAYAYKHR